MTIDMSQFYEVFFDEAEELLAEAERLLLGIEIEDPDFTHVFFTLFIGPFIFKNPIFSCLIFHIFALCSNFILFSILTFTFSNFS